MSAEPKIVASIKNVKTETLAENVKKLQIIGLIGLTINTSIMVIDLALMRQPNLEFWLRFCWSIASIAYILAAKSGLHYWQKYTNAPFWLAPVFWIATSLTILFPALITGLMSSNYGPSSVFIISLVLICAFLIISPKVLLLIMAPGLLALIILSFQPRPLLIHSINTIISFVATIIFSLAIAINNWRKHLERWQHLAKIEAQNQQLMAFSEIDGLSKLANHTRIEQFISSLEGMAKHQNIAVSVIIMDIDNFSSYNKHHGHQAGDKAIQSIAAAVRSKVIPESDFMGRWSGDTFIIILTSRSIESTPEVCTKIENTLIDLAISFPEHVSGYLKVNLGVASAMIDQNNHLRTIIATADKNLYQTKINIRT